MLHCNNSTTLEDFSDSVLVESNLSERADIEGIGTNMDSDQVGFRTLNCSFLSILSSWNLVCSCSPVQRGTLVAFLFQLCKGFSLLALCICRKLKPIMFHITKATFSCSIVDISRHEIMKSQEVLQAAYDALKDLRYQACFPRKRASHLVFQLDV